jgi:hypothetical protein
MLDHPITPPTTLTVNRSDSNRDKAISLKIRKRADRIGKTLINSGNEADRERDKGD